MFEVVYYSRGGNTRKVAEAVAAELGTAARDIKTVDRVADGANIILGSGCYGAVLAKDIADFLDRNHKPGRKIAMFTTSVLGLGKEVELMEKQIRDKGVEVAGSFNCYGQFLGVKKGHPDKDDLDKAREFARGLAAVEDIRAQAVRPGHEAVGAVV
jgi:flavodoxin